MVMTNPKAQMGQVNEDTVSSYSERGSRAYEESVNKDVLYGKITVDFLKQIPFESDEKTILDMGAGTGFAFDVLGPEFEKRDMTGIGVEPAEGMLEIARQKYPQHPRFSFLKGSFEHIPLGDHSVDKIISTLALHWVKDLDVAARELHRVLRPKGSVHVLMIARDDGFRFKRTIVEVLQNYLSFSQIIKAAGLTQRVDGAQLQKAFAMFEGELDVKVDEFRDVVYGGVEEYLTLWKARSSPVMHDIQDKEAFLKDLREKWESIRTDRGVPFDISYLWLTIQRRKK